MKRVAKIALPGKRKDYTKTARFKRLAKEYLMNDQLVFDKEEPRSKKPVK